MSLDSVINKSIALQRSIDIATKNSQGFAVRYWEINVDGHSWNFGEIRYPETPTLLQYVAKYRNETGFDQRDVLPMNDFIDLYHQALKDDKEKAENEQA